MKELSLFEQMFPADWNEKKNDMLFKEYIRTPEQKGLFDKVVLALKDEIITDKDIVMLLDALPYDFAEVFINALGRNTNEIQEKLHKNYYNDFIFDCKLQNDGLTRFERRYKEQSHIQYRTVRRRIISKAEVVCLVRMVNKIENNVDNRCADLFIDYKGDNKHLKLLIKVYNELEDVKLSNHLHNKEIESVDELLCLILANIDQINKFAKY